MPSIAALFTQVFANGDMLQANNLSTSCNSTGLPTDNDVFVTDGNALRIDGAVMDD